MDFSIFGNISAKERKTLEEIVENNRKFYGSINFSNMPLVDIATVNSNGLEVISSFFTVPIDVNGTSYNFTFRKSTEQNCWFVKVEYGDEVYNGIVHYNCVLNWGGSSAFSFLNSNDGVNFNDITNTLKYTNIVVMVK